MSQPNWIKRRTAIPVNFTTNFWDIQIKEYTLAGFTAPMIAAVTGLTVSRIRYRLKILKLSAMDYRRGTSKEAKAVQERIDKQIRFRRDIKFFSVEDLLAAPQEKA